MMSYHTETDDIMRPKPTPKWKIKPPSFKPDLRVCLAAQTQSICKAKLNMAIIDTMDNLQ